MILYTTMPLEKVLEGHDHPIKPTVEMTIEGKQVVIEPGEHNSGKIVRLISTEPNDFLDPRFQPGNKVIFTSVISTN
ncbi:MAG TPA: YlzJ-like family protein [Bacillota bacterium]|nr:YlzJ-like family protein [Bacillota bacterium]